MSPQQVLELLGRFAPESEKYRFIEMLAFNVHLGNADAHENNYSVFLDDEVRMTPLYDAVPTLLWPALTDDRLAMTVGGARRSPEVQMANWAKLARVSHLDVDAVLEIVARVGAGIRELSTATFRGAGLSDEMIDRWEHVVASTTRHLPD
jgi:serine/threonine protein kinase HipA of HipAB toxin-antitoxin module